MTLSTARRLSMTSLAILAGTLALATPVLAQQRVSTPGDGRSSGMRYLTWPGKGEHRAPIAPTAVTAPEPREETEGRGPILSMPSQPLVAPVATRYSARTSPGPTPATAWVSGAPTPSPAPYDSRTAMMPEPPRGFAPAPPLAGPARDTPTYAPPRVEAPRYETPSYEAPRPERPVYDMPPSAPVEADTPTPTYAPIPAEARRTPVAADTGPAAAETAPPTDAPPAGVDPYAPRADAPIFRLLNRNSQPAPAPTAADPQPTVRAAETAPPPAPSAAAAPSPYPVAASETDRSPRRYSVHRANGQSPDRVPLPDPVLLDSAPVDLAEPPETPTVVRNINGRLTAITPASEDPSQP